MSIVERGRELLERAGIHEVQRSAVILVVVLTVVGLGIVGWRTLGGQPTVVLEESAPSDSGVSAPADQSSVDASSTAELCVHVVGAVRDPGVYVLENGARVADAIELAGGLLGNAAARAVNLARPVVDGEQIHVATIDEYEQGAVPIAGDAPEAPGDTGGKVELNSADAATLETLPGIGPATASAILSDREENGPFGRTEDLMRVAGIGAKKFEAVADLVVVR